MLFRSDGGISLMPAKRPANSNAVELQGHFGGMSLMLAMRRASEFRELLTEKSSIFVLKKAAIFFYL